MRDISYFELGATMYIPANNKNLEKILKREKFKNLKSAVICFEDSINEVNLDNSIERFDKLMSNFEPTSLKLFIRPRNIINLKTLIKVKNIDMIDGFVLPKFDTTNATDYLSIFIEKNNFYLMPVLESKDIFDNSKMYDIANELLPFKDRILSIRIGGEDILSILNMMRECNKTIYEIMPLYIIISNIINIFRTNEFNISSPVYACFKNSSFLKKEIENDVKHQLFNKTIIHPNQIDLVHDSYKVFEEDLKIAKKLLFENEPIFSFNGRMFEKKTHSNWAKGVIERYKIYGIKDTNV